MKIKKLQEIKVDKNIKPIHFKLRKVPELIIGKDYYISFGMNLAAPCVLLEILNQGHDSQTRVHIGLKDNSPRGYSDINTVYSDEIGCTPEEAVMNTHTS